MKGKYSSESQNEKGSPRAYVCYTYNEYRIPNPDPFLEGMDKYAIYIGSFI